MLLKIELKTQSKNKEYYDKKTKLPNFKGGDRVFLKIEKVEIGKKKARTKMDGTVLNN
jgi:ribosomal protein L19